VTIEPELPLDGPDVHNTDEGTTDGATLLIVTADCGADGIGDLGEGTDEVPSRELLVMTVGTRDGDTLPDEIPLGADDDTNGAALLGTARVPDEIPLGADDDTNGAALLGTAEGE
jgi:hypothetical protein